MANAPFKMKGFSGFTSSPMKKTTDPKKKVDPDAPGTPGTPGYEPPVVREELDAMGKKIWDCNHNPKTRWDNKLKKCVKK